MFPICNNRRLDARPHLASGFTLVELLMTMLVLGILLSIAIPGYKDYLIRANKSAIKAVMLEVASRQEQYVMISGTYGALAQLNYTVPAEVSAVFDIQLSTGTNSGSTVTALQGLPTFSLTASGKANTIQAGHPAAGATTQLSINQFGLKLPINEW
ncbi:MAG: prepilin-type N-terminal cleavage/methylation domain-containing protein [Rhodocyclales bacterium]|nr:prepilin-type N-terminal cleavage/methylation domain-containing protein [Rhodocyclales bacterium]